MANKENNEIVGVLNTAVVRAKVSGEKRKYIIDLKITADDASDVMFKLERYVQSLVSIKIQNKQLKFGEE